MFIGHFAFAFGAKKVAPGITAFAPPEFVSDPYSHSRVALIGCAAALAVAYAPARNGRRLVDFLAVVYAANMLGPPPPGVMAIAWTRLTLWRLVDWDWWADRQRIPKEK